jgi:transcriptional regulator with XRE-family HTH domain
MNVGRMIVRQRLRLGLTQAQIAERAGTKQSRISELETLSGNVRFDTLDKIATVLGLEVTLQERPQPFAGMMVYDSILNRMNDSDWMYSAVGNNWQWTDNSVGTISFDASVPDIQRARDYNLTMANNQPH